MTAALTMVVILYSIPLAAQCVQDARLLAANPPNEQELIACDLKRLGLQPGENVVDIDPLRQYYWARVARLKIVAEVLDWKSFFQDYPKRQDAIVSTLSSCNVKALVLCPGFKPPPIALQSGWQSIAGGRCYVYVIK